MAHHGDSIIAIIHGTEANTNKWMDRLLDSRFESFLAVWPNNKQIIKPLAFSNLGILAYILYFLWCKCCWIHIVSDTPMCDVLTEGLCSMSGADDFPLRWTKVANTVNSSCQILQNVIYTVKNHVMLNAVSARLYGCCGIYTYSMLANYKLKHSPPANYKLKHPPPCAPAEGADAHFSGYFNKQCQKNISRNPKCDGFVENAIT